MRTQFGHCRFGNTTGGNGRYFADGSLSIFQLVLRRRNVGKQKPHRRLRQWGLLNLRETLRTRLPRGSAAARWIAADTGFYSRGKNTGTTTTRQILFSNFHNTDIWNRSSGSGFNPTPTPRPTRIPHGIGIRIRRCTRTRKPFLPNPLDVTVAEGLVVAIRGAGGSLSPMVGTPRFQAREDHRVVCRERSHFVRIFRRRDSALEPAAR